MKRHLKTIIGIIAILAAMVFFARQFHANWTAISLHSWDVSYPLLVAAFGLMCLIFPCYALIMKAFLSHHGARLSTPKVLFMWLASNFGKYIPGKVWLFAGWAYLCSKEGIPKRLSGSLMLLGVGMNCVASVLVFFLALFLIGPGFSYVNPLLLVLPLILGLVLMHPRVFQSVLNLLLVRILKREPIKIQTGYPQMLVILCANCAIWLVYGLVNFLIIMAFYRGPISGGFFGVAGIFAVSWFIGFISFVTPGGLGVREVTTVALLGQLLPSDVAHVATVVPLVSRVIFSLAETIDFGGAYFLKRLLR